MTENAAPSMTATASSMTKRRRRVTVPTAMVDVAGLPASAMPVHAAAPRTVVCKNKTRVLDIVDVRRTNCASGLAVAKKWRAATGYTPGIDGPSRNGMVLTVSGYSCVYRSTRRGSSRRADHLHEDGGTRIRVDVV